MNPFKQFNMPTKELLKKGGTIVGLIILAYIAITLFSSLHFGATSYIGGPHHDMEESVDYKASRAGVAQQELAMVASDAAYGGGIVPSPIPNATIATNAEESEAMEYDIWIESRDGEKTCEALYALKPREDVIFQESIGFDHGCNYTFKVKKESTEEVLAIINELNPKQVSEQIYSIQNIVDDFTTREEILLRKQESIESTLNEALTAYDEITRIARNAGNANALANVIDGKVRIIERLTNERIAVRNQLDHLLKSKEEQLDKLSYTYMYVRVTENNYIDGEQLKNSWKYSLKYTIEDVNDIVQLTTLGLLRVVAYIVQFAIYLLIILYAVKYGWRIGKKIWLK